MISSSFLLVPMIFHQSTGPKIGVEGAEWPAGSCDPSQEPQKKFKNSFPIFRQDLELFSLIKLGVFGTPVYRAIGFFCLFYFIYLRVVPVIWCTICLLDVLRGQKKSSDAPELGLPMAVRHLGSWD